MSELLREQLVSRKHTLETVDTYQVRGVEDEIWVKKFRAAGGEAIVSGDVNITRKPHEIVAINETGLRLVVLDEKWARAKKHVQISYLFFWWPHIEAALESAKSGQCLKVPWGWPANPEGMIKPITIDLQKAYKQIKKRK